MVIASFFLGPAEKGGLVASQPEISFCLSSRNSSNQSSPEGRSRYMGNSVPPLPNGKTDAGAQVFHAKGTQLIWF